MSTGNNKALDLQVVTFFALADSSTTLDGMNAFSMAGINLAAL
jgi:hypothetical protein